MTSCCTVCIAEQNVDNNKMWAGGHYSRKVLLEHNDENGSWTIRDDEVGGGAKLQCL